MGLSGIGEWGCLKVPGADDSVMLLFGSLIIGSRKLSGAWDVACI